MKSSKAAKLAMMYGLAAVMNPEAYNAQHHLSKEEYEKAHTPKPIKKIIPKGCKEYFFNQHGGFRNHDKKEYVFKCIASSEKVAIKKFNKWKSNNL